MGAAGALEQSAMSGSTGSLPLIPTDRERPDPDIGIRPLLALAVKQCATDAEAQEVVEYFYDAFDEAAGK